MKEETTVYKNGCVARLKNKRILSKLSKDKNIIVELYNMVEKGKEQTPVVFAGVNKRRSALVFKLSQEGAKALVITLIETLKLDNQEIV